MTKRTFKVGDVISLKDTEKIALKHYILLRAKDINVKQFWIEYRKVMNETVKLQIVELPEVDD